MKKIKLINFIAISFLCFFVFPFIGEAKKTSGLDNCVNANTCLHVCEWQNAEYHVYAYYFFDGTWKFSWYYSVNPFIANREATGSLPTKNIFYEANSLKTNLTTKGICPSGAYVDVSAFGTPELCLDSNQTYCHDKSDGNIGTNFKNLSSLIYEINDHIGIYFDEHAISALEQTSCDEFSDDTGYLVDVSKTGKLLDKIKKDFSTNFLYGNGIPTFINNGAYSSEIARYGSKLQLKINACAVSLKEKAESDLKKGVINQKKYDEMFPNDEIDFEKLEEQVSEQIGQMDDAIEEGVPKEEPEEGTGGGPIIDPTEASCETLLGDETTKFLKTALSIIQIAGVILAIVLGMVDYLGAVLSGEADSIKKANKKFTVRVAMAAVLLLVPMLLKFVLNTFGVGGDSFCIL